MKRSDNQIISYLVQRKLLGFLGVLMPFVMVVGSQLQGWTAIQNSISAYFFMNVREVFVAILAFLALFFVTYKGYDKRDNILTNIAGFLALNIAIFPSMRETTLDVNYLFAFLSPKLTDAIHLASASSFFLILSYISYYVFTKSGIDAITNQKRLRNKLYRICGLIIFLSLIIMGITEILPQSIKDLIHPFRPIFVFESVSLFAFGISWLVKGGLFLRD